MGTLIMCSGGRAGQRQVGIGRGIGGGGHAPEHGKACVVVEHRRRGPPARKHGRCENGVATKAPRPTWCSMFERLHTCSTSACVLDPVRRSSVRVPKPCCSARLRPASTVIASTPVSGGDQVDRDGCRTRPAHQAKIGRGLTEHHAEASSCAGRFAVHGVSLRREGAFRATLAGIPKFPNFCQRSH